MDERFRQDVANWLDFYRELGIEEYYRRAPGSPVALPLSRLTEPESRAVAHSVLAPAPSATETKPAGGPPPPAPRLKPESSPETNSPPLQGGLGVSYTAAAKPFTPSLSLFEMPPAKPIGPETLEQIRAHLGDCHLCKLAAGRKTIVFGDGNPHAELVFVGEGPGADEDEQGLPFVGRAGQLLNRMIQMIGMKREEVYICNVVKCRPPGNRTPERDEIEMCSPFLFRQLEAIKPRLICCLGAPAVRTVLGIKEGITKIHGKFYDFAIAKALATVHPAYVLRNPREEKILREDFENIREFLKGK
jgi:DNA polymerase